MRLHLGNKILLSNALKDSLPAYAATVSVLSSLGVKMRYRETVS